MIRKKIQIINQLGLHARACAKLVQTTSLFNSHIEISKGETCVNGKSIIGIMMLAANKASWIDIMVAGPDEQEALKAIEELIKNKFGEEK